MDKTHLIIKNLPSNVEDLSDFFREKYGAVSVKPFGRRRTILKFPNEETATSVLYKLHQNELFERILSVEYLGSRKVTATEENEGEAADTSKNDYQIADYVKALYATSIRHGFEQPPPPYLRYSYPKINRTILDSISIELLKNPCFYTQVLHLMNRMNLEPPFIPRNTPFIPPGDPRDVQTQTDFRRGSEKLLATDESELESDEEVKKDSRNLVKRKVLLDDVQLRKKARKILSSHLQVKTISSTVETRQETRCQVFDVKEKFANVQRINLNISSIKLPDKEAVREEQEFQESQENQENVPAPKHSISKCKADMKEFSVEDLKSNRIPEAQMNDLPIFKNYQRGLQSNKLYIKNLSKDVVENDLIKIYELFKRPGDSVDIKLMQHGRMKGQAFVTFNTTDENVDIVEKALLETNGYILKNKPMVVCFGKKS